MHKTLAANATRTSLALTWLRAGRSFFVCDTGGVLNQVTHFYSFPSLAVRAGIRSTLAANKEWQRYIDQARPFVAHQESMIMLEASDCHAAAGVPPASQFSPPARTATPALYEMRTYQLILGYNPVPELRTAFRAGLPSKVSRDKEGKLVLMCYSDVGRVFVTALLLSPRAERSHALAPQRAEQSY